MTIEAYRFVPREAEIQTNKRNYHRVQPSTYKCKNRYVSGPNIPLKYSDQIYNKSSNTIFTTTTTPPPTSLTPLHLKLDIKNYRYTPPIIFGNFSRGKILPLLVPSYWEAAIILPTNGTARQHASSGAHESDSCNIISAYALT